MGTCCRWYCYRYLGCFQCFTSVFIYCKNLLSAKCVLPTTRNISMGWPKFQMNDPIMKSDRTAIVNKEPISNNMSYKHLKKRKSALVWGVPISNLVIVPWHNWQRRSWNFLIYILIPHFPPETINWPCLTPIYERWYRFKSCKWKIITRG